MKKVLTVLSLVLVLCACVYAEQKVSVSINPYSFQHFVQKDGSVKEKVNSTYGLGAGAGYDWKFYDNFRVGAEAKFDTYYLKDQENFVDVTLAAKVGYDCQVSDDIALYANIKAALDIQTHDKKTSAVFQFGPEVGCGYKINDKFDVFAGCEMLFGFPKKDEVKYTEFRVTPVLGVSYAF